MDDATFKKFIADWFWKARQENRPGQMVSKFMFLWICFNARLAHESNGYTDAEMIKWLKAARPEASALRAGFDRLAENNEFQANLRNLINLGPIPDTRQHPKRKPEVRIANTQDFKNVVGGIYQVRCNLFHGSTDASDTMRILLCGRLLFKWVGTLL